MDPTATAWCETTKCNMAEPFDAKKSIIFLNILPFFSVVSIMEAARERTSSPSSGFSILASRSSGQQRNRVTDVVCLSRWSAEKLFITLLRRNSNSQHNFRGTALKIQTHRPYTASSFSFTHQTAPTRRLVKGLSIKYKEIVPTTSARNDRNFSYWSHDQDWSCDCHTWAKRWIHVIFVWMERGPQCHKRGLLGGMRRGVRTQKNALHGGIQERSVNIIDRVYFQYEILMTSKVPWTVASADSRHFFPYWVISY